MTAEEIIHLIPSFISLAISITVLAYTWSKRQSKGAAAFALYCFGQALWIIGFILELTAHTLGAKIFWDGFQWATTVITLISLPIFAVTYTEYKLRDQKLLLRLSLIVPLAFLFIICLDPVRHWIYPNPQLIFIHPFLELTYSFTPAIYLYAIYDYAITFWALYILFRRFIRPHSLYQSQLALISLGFFIPTLGTALPLLHVEIIPGRDIIPITAAIGNMLIGWGVFYFRIFEIAPIARDKIFEAMVEPVVVVDNKNNIVDINTSMLALLGKNSDEVIGEPAKSVFADFPIPIKQYLQTSYARTEASFELGGISIHYEMTVWPLYNAEKEMTGRIFISHDITALKQLENELRKLNAQLEDRVHARTRELAEAYDTTLEGWARALELRDKETEGHSRRVTENTLKIAIKMGFPEELLEQLRRGAILHDIGKMGIPDDILHKPGKLTDEEREIVKKHPETAYNLLAPIPFLQRALDIPYCHHEKWDGTGYPRGLKGEEIPVAARIFAVADVWDALTSDRPYNPAWPREKAAAYFFEQSGKHFDPHIVNIFLDMVEKGEI